MKYLAYTHINATVAALDGVFWSLTLAILCLVYLYDHYAFVILSGHVTSMYVASFAMAVAVGDPVYLAAISLAVFFNFMVGPAHYAMGPRQSISVLAS